MKKRGGLTVSTNDGTVRLVMETERGPVIVYLPPEQARELARILRNAADFAAAAAMGEPRGHA